MLKILISTRNDVTKLIASISYFDINNSINFFFLFLFIIKKYIIRINFGLKTSILDLIPLNQK